MPSGWVMGLSKIVNSHSSNKVALAFRLVSIIYIAELLIIISMKNINIIPINKSKIVKPLIFVSF